MEIMLGRRSLTLMRIPFDLYCWWLTVFVPVSCSQYAMIMLVWSFKGGGWLSNGTLVNYGGQSQQNIPSGNGFMGIRLFTPQPNGAGEVFEDPDTLHLTTNRLALFSFLVISCWWNICIEGGILPRLGYQMARKSFLEVCSLEDSTMSPTSTILQ